RLGIVPILNENDVVSIDELAGFRAGTSKTYSFSDNDVLSALVAAGMAADVLVILSDVDGFYTTNPIFPDARRLPLVPEISPDMWKMASKGGAHGRGGMVTKLKAAEIVTRSGAYMILCHAKKHSLQEIFSVNNAVQGTLFCPIEKLPMREVWLLYATNVSGSCQVDEGAKNAIMKGASLLLPGILKVAGSFNRGDCIEILDANGRVFAKGLVNISSVELNNLIEGKKANNIRKTKNLGDIISRYNLAFFREKTKE
ncbi:MAG: glutamate 5-kinase, partial [Candidatus Ranarchaeia archaeon]